MILKNKRIGISKVKKAGFYYVIGNFFIKGINFITLPIFSRLLTTAEFGVYNVFLSYESILCIVVGLAFHSSIKSANIEYKSKINDYVFSIISIYIFNFCLFIVVLFLFKGWITYFLNFDTFIIIMLIVYSLSNAIIMLYNEVVALEYSYKKYLTISLITSISNTVISLLLILTIFNSNRLYGRIIGIVAPSVLVSIFITFGFIKKSNRKLENKYIKFAFAYSLPIVPHGISQVLLGQVDRVMIRRIVSDEAAGLYSLAGNIKLVLTVITNSMSTAWSTWFYEKMQNDEINKIQIEAKKLSYLFMILVIVLMFLSPEIVYILGGNKYNLAKFVAIPMLMDAHIMFLYNLIVPAEYYRNKTMYIMYGTIFAAAVNILLNYICIEKFGWISAAYTSLIAYICYFILHYNLSKKAINNIIVSLNSIIYMFVTLLISAIMCYIFINNTIIRIALAFFVSLFTIYFNKGTFFNDKE